MSYLLYCIFRGPLPAALEIPDGVGGYHVFTANYSGLGAALSKLAEPDPPPDASKLLVYEAVVESFYRHLTVIPMRYGCQVGCPYEAVVLLRENHDAYGALLQELEGLGEMAVHVLLDTSRDGMESRAWPVRSRSLPLDADSGAAYLAARRQRYLGLDRAGLEQSELVKELCDSLYGSFVRHKVEFPSSRRSRLLSLYFLVPRDSVECFRRAVRRLHRNESMKLLLSGPWPPYNFVDSLQPEVEMQSNRRSAGPAGAGPARATTSRGATPPRSITTQTVLEDLAGRGLPAAHLGAAFYGVNSIIARHRATYGLRAIAFFL